MNSPKDMLILLKQVETYQSYLSKLNKGVGDKSQIPIIIKKILEKLTQLEQQNLQLTTSLQPTIPIPQPKKTVAPKSNIPIPEPKIKVPRTFESETFKNLTKEEKNKFLKDLGLTTHDIQDYIKRSKKSKKAHFEIKEDYTIYKPNPYGEFANKYMQEHSLNLLAKYPKLFGPLFNHIQRVHLNLISTTYVSLMLVCTILAFPALFIVFTILNLSFQLNFLIITGISILATIATFFGFYFYPSSLISQRANKIKNELPFALVHMGAVAGSGANPLSIFELISESDGYEELKRETKKILNYVNLFGYNLSGALKRVSKTTPSPDFKEVLEGIVTTVETGGSLKDYLNEKSEDALRQYKQRKKKQVEALATYSDVYTAILIAAPLLLIVTLAIINVIGGDLGGFDAKTLSILGVYGLIPLMNLAFMAFLHVSQPT